MRDPGPPPRFEEKETDVNVAVHMVAGALKNRYDTALVVSGDTDMVPAMRMVRSEGKRVLWGCFAHQVGMPDLRKVSDGVFVLSDRLLRSCEYLVVRR